MSFTYAEKITPFTLSPTALDDYLARGWYRMGASIFTTHFLFFQGEVYSAIWIRLDLQDFKFSKRQRKLLRKNAAIFDVATNQRVIDAERNEVYTAYAEDFDGRLSPSIEDSLEDYGDNSVFNTWETTIRVKNNGQLVGASYFDVGDQAAASILGYYLPQMKPFSLGYYTMLLEIQYCLDNGIRYYYPGYVVPGYGRFDYKLRLGASEYYDVRADAWLPVPEGADFSSGPTEVQRGALEALAVQLRATEGVAGTEMENTRVLTYPLFEAGLYDVWTDDYLPYPYLLVISGYGSQTLLIVTYDPRERLYLLLVCSHLHQTQLMFNVQHLQEDGESNFFTDLLAIRRVVHATADVGDTAGICLLFQNIIDKI